jgi:hypothetical protein
MKKLFFAFAVTIFITNQTGAQKIIPIEYNGKKI